MRVIKIIGIIVGLLGLLTAIIALATEVIRLGGELPTPAIQTAEGGSQQITTPLQDVRVRQAIAYCTDNEALARAVYPSFSDSQIEAAIMDSILPKKHWAYVKPTTQYPYDPAKGQALLAEAGWGLVSNATYRINSTGDELSLNFTTTQAEIRHIWAALFESQMQACGIRILRLHVGGEWLFGVNTGLQRRDFELVGFAWEIEENVTVDTMYGCNSIPSKDNGWQGLNYMGWCNQAANQAVAMAVNTQLSQSERRSYFATIQEEAAKDMISLPLFIRDDNGWEHIDFNILP